MFTEENKPLLGAAAAIVFQLKKNGAINPSHHDSYELGLFFIKKAVEVHGNKYGYGKVKYVNSSTKVTITCAVHRDFEQTPSAHRLKGQGCPLCAISALQNTETFIKRALDIYGNKYDYSVTRYTGANAKLDIICLIHGRYSIKASHHLSGRGCAQCYYDSLKMTTEEFIQKAENIHGDKYDYSSVHYKLSKEKLEIICHKHGPFLTTPDKHINQGSGCQKCSGNNHNILYLLKCNETGWYKIGITTDSAQKRLASLGGNLEEVHHVRLEDPRKHESILHNKYKDFNKYHEVVRSGKTEFFSLTEDQVKEVIDYMNEVSKIA